MATKKVGELIKEARTNAKLSQTALGELVGVSGSDIGKAERGEKELTQTQLKAIAKATGVTQKSLLEAPKGGAAAAASAAKKTGSTAKTSSASSKKTASTAKSGSASSKKTASTAKSSSASTQKAASTTAVELTSAEKTMLNAYRKADADTRKAALKLLKGEQDPDILSALLQSFTGGSGGNGGLLDLLGNLGKK